MVRTPFLPTILLLGCVFSHPLFAREVPIISTVSGISPVGSGTVNLSETRDANGKVLKVAQILRSNDTIQIGSHGTITRLWWFCSPSFDTIGLSPLNPGPNGETPKIDLNVIKGVSTLVRGTIPADTTVADTSKLAKEIRHYQLDWRQQSQLTLVSVTLLDNNGNTIGSSVAASPAAVFSKAAASSTAAAKSWQSTSGRLELTFPASVNILGRSR